MFSVCNAGWCNVDIWWQMLQTVSNELRLTIVQEHG